MASLTLELVTPERKLFSASVGEVVVPGEVGLFGVRPRHTALVSLLSDGPLTVKGGPNGDQTFFVAGGFAQVSQDRVLVLADQAEPATSIDVAAAQGRWKAAKERLKTLPSSDPQYAVEAATVRREAARLAVAGRPAQA